MVSGRNVEPIRNLLEAQRIRTEYKDPAAREESLKRVSRAIGSDKPLPLLRPHLDEIFEGDSIISDMVLNLALVETRKK
jgi:hypothetical protein